MSLNDARPEEQRIIRRLMADAIAAGFSLAVFDGGRQTTEPTQDVPTLEAALCTTDDDRLRLFMPGGAQLGAVWLIYGNGTDVLSDWTDRPAIDKVLEGALEESDTISAEQLAREVKAG